MRFKTIVSSFLAIILLAVSAASAARLVLNDGSVLEGTIIKTSDGYWVKLSDGSTKIVPREDVQTYSGDAPAGDSADSSPPIGDDAAMAFRQARSHADDAEAPAAAVSAWQQFIDKYPGSPDIATARQEVDRWKKLADDGAEKINGVWVGGADRKQIVDQAEELTRQAVEMLDNKQTLQAVDKLKQAVKVYPNSFLTNFCLGYVSLIEGDYDNAAQYFVTTIRLHPDSAEAVNNLGVANIERKRFEIAIDEFLSAAKIQDSKDVVENLVTALAIAPSDLRTLPKMRSTIEAASLLASQYNISGPAAAGFTILPPPVGHSRPPRGAPPDESPDAGITGWSGTGFFVTSDGLILTNRHVSKGSKTLMVELASGEKIAADIVAIDDRYDLSLIRLVDRNRKVPCINLAPEDSPAEGADCVVMGFPMVDQLGFDLKITRGVVSSSAQDQGNGADVLTDAKVNPGNSGGPVVDKFGNVMAIVSMKSVTQGDFDSYGIGISAGHIREFLRRNHVDLPLGDETGAQLSTEDLVTRTKPATVCIIATTN